MLSLEFLFREKESPFFLFFFFFSAGLALTMQLLLFCVLVIVLTQTSAASYPTCPDDCNDEGNYHGICRTDYQYRSAHDWIPYANSTSGDGIKWRVIIDQYDYQNIFGQFNIPPGVWIAVDHDRDGLGVSIHHRSSWYSIILTRSQK